MAVGAEAVLRGRREGEWFSCGDGGVGWAAWVHGAGAVCGEASPGNQGGAMGIGSAVVMVAACLRGTQVEHEGVAQAQAGAACRLGLLQTWGGCWLVAGWVVGAHDRKPI